MELQNQAINIIERISQRLDPLFKRFDVHVKYRESDSSIFAEYLRYEKGNIQLKISACLHPHDYPNSLGIELADKNFLPRKYINQREIFDMVQKFCGVQRSDLLIATESHLQCTVEDLYVIMECILKNYSRLNTEATADT